MLKRLTRSFYLKMFLSFLAVCVLFFLALALFWSSYFSELFYRDKKEMLMNRANDMTQVLNNMQEGSMSSRELRIALRLLSRTFKGDIWIVDGKGTILFSSRIEQEGLPIPSSIEDRFTEALGNSTDYFIGHLFPAEPKGQDNYLTYYMPLQINSQQGVAFFHTPVNDITRAITMVRLNIWIPLLFCLLAVGLILFIMSRKLAGPLRDMNRASLSIAEGDFSSRVPLTDSKDEIGQLAVSFNLMAGKLEEWEGTRQEFLANVSHELRSPLTTLRGMILGMKDHVIPADRHPQYLQICENEVQRLQRLTDDLLDLARIQNGTDVFRMDPVDMIAESCEVVDLLAPVMDAKGLRLEVWIPDGGEADPPIVMLDADRYAQILNNLLYNAMKFTPEGGLVRVHLGSQDGDFVLEVRDSGIGMTEEETKRIWDRFYKADPSRIGSEGGGTGLGLTIVKHLVGGMNGRIAVESEMGRGTAFTVKFPLLKVQKFV